MADPLSVIASVLGVATAGIALATKLHDIVDEFGSTFEEIGLIAKDLDALAIVMREIARKLDPPDSHRIASAELVDGITNVMTTCKVLFKDINRMIVRVEISGSRMAKFRTKVSWVFRKTRVRGIQATLGGQKATLSLMVQVLQDDQSTFHRAILSNLFREYQRALKALESIEKENALLRSKEKNPASKSGKVNKDAVYLPGGASSVSSDEQSVMVVLSNAVPRRNQDVSFIGEVSVPRGQDTQGNDPFASLSYNLTSSTEYSPPGLQPTLGSPSNAQEKSGIDLILSKWIQHRDIPSQNTTNPQYSCYHPPTSTVSAPGVQNRNNLPETSLKGISNDPLILQIMTEIKALESERENILSKIEIEKAKVQGQVAARLKLELQNSEHDFNHSLLILSRANENSRSDLEKRLMTCEADQERRTSVEAELERCRQEYATRMRDNPSGSHEPLERHIQNMQDRLSYDRVELGNLSVLRKDVLGALKSLQKDHDDQMAMKTAKHHQDIEKIKVDRAVDEEARKAEQVLDLETRRKNAEDQIKQLEERLLKEIRDLASTKHTSPGPQPVYEMPTPANEMLQNPVNRLGELIVPHWLNDNSASEHLDSDDEGMESRDA